jgi:hypothetical protein
MRLEDARDLLGRQHPVRYTGLERGARHSSELRAVDVLYDDEPAGFVNIANPA